MRIIKLKNCQASTDTYCGQQISAGEYYEVQSEQERVQFAKNAKVQNHMSSDPVKLLISDGDEDLTYDAGRRWLEADIAQEVAVKEEDIKTGGHFQAMCFEHTTGTENEVTSKEISFPIPISLLSAEWTASAENEGDEAEFLIAPDAIVGTITSDIAVDDTVLDVSQTVIDNIEIGYWCKVDSEDFGRVLDIDEDNLQITIENAATTTHTSGAYVKQTVKMVPCAHFSEGVRAQLGESKIGGSYIPANTVLKFNYDKKSGATAKKFHFILEYLY